MEYTMRNKKTGEVTATAYTVLVMFDYVQMKTFKVSDDFKRKVGELQK